MSCCAPIYSRKENAELTTGKCPYCGNDIREDGTTTSDYNCGYSKVVCRTCGFSPCDNSC